MMTPPKARKVMILATAILGWSCGGGTSSPTTPPPPPPTPVLTSIAIAGGNSVTVGATLALVASPKDQNGSAIAATITWSSGAPGVATVSSSGVVTGVAVGTAVITAASGSVSANATITVTALPVLTSIIVSGGTTVVVGATLQLTAAPMDQNGSAIAATIVWSSGAPGVATVNSNGVVTGVAAGTAVITAASGTANSPVAITVTPTPPGLATIAISGGTTVVAKSTLQLAGSPKDQYGNAFAAVLTWSSGATGVASVSSTGLVTAVTAGTVVITAASGSVSATQSITVTPQVLTSMTVTGVSTVQVGQAIQLSANSLDQNGVAMTVVVTWASDATSVATVSSSGVVTGVAVGPANITASSGAVSSLQDAITVTAVPAFPSSANINATTGAVFDPPTVDIARNGTIHWVFASLGHTMVFDTSAPGTPADISSITSNATVSRTFTTAGTYPFHCTVHGAAMAGTVIVH